MASASKQVLDGPSIQRALSRMAHEILEKNKGGEKLALIGIQTRGVVLAARLHQAIEAINGLKVPTGILDINLYRDDLTLVSEHPILKKTEINFDLDGLSVVLVDDVLRAGGHTRTLAALAVTTTDL